MAKATETVCSRTSDCPIPNNLLAITHLPVYLSSLDALFSNPNLDCFTTTETLIVIKTKAVIWAEEPSKRLPLDPHLFRKTIRISPCVHSSPIPYLQQIVLRKRLSKLDWKSASSFLCCW